MQADAADDVFVKLRLISRAPTDAAVYYEWLLALTPGARPGDALARIGVEAVVAPPAGEEAVGWLPVFRVDSIDDAVASAAAFGAVERRVDDGSGTRPYLIDGAGVWTGLTESIEAPFAGRHANVDYSAIDVDGAEALFASTLALERLEMVDDPYDMRFLRRGRRIAAGVFRLHGVADFSVRPYWFVYFEVDDLVMHVARAAESGSRVLIPPTPSPFNLYAVLEDPWGSVFAFSQLTPSQSLGPLPVADGSGPAGDLADHIDLFPAHG